GRQLTVKQFRITVAPTGVHPAHSVWAVTQTGLGVKTSRAVSPGQDFGSLIDEVRAQCHGFGQRILACWITPEIGLHEMTPIGAASSKPQLARLETRIVSDNQAVVIACALGGGKQQNIAEIGCNLVILCLEDAKSRSDSH